MGGDGYDLVEFQTKCIHHSFTVVSSIALPKHITCKTESPSGKLYGFVAFSNFEPLFGLKSAMPVRIRLQLTRRPLQKSSLLLSCTALWERAVIKSVCVALHMEFLIVLSCGERWREWERARMGEVFYSPTLCYTACMTLSPHRKCFHLMEGGGASWDESNRCSFAAGLYRKEICQAQRLKMY